MIISKKNYDDISQIDVMVSLEKGKISEILDRSYLEIKMNETFKGFKKGEAPLEYVKKNTSTETILAKSFPELVRSAIIEANSVIKDSSTIDDPIYNVTELGIDKFVVNLSFQIYPKIRDFNYKNTSAKFIEPAYSMEEQINYELKFLENKYSELVKVDRKHVIEKDLIYVDMEYSIISEQTETQKLTNVPIKLGDGAFVKGFEEKVIGRNIGERFEIELVMPDNHHMESSRGKTAKYIILINSIMEVKAPELNDELIIKLGIKGVNTFNEFILYLKENIAKVQLQKAKNLFFDQTFSELRRQLNLKFSPNYLASYTNKSIKHFENNLIRNKGSLEAWLKENGLTMDQFFNQQMQISYNQIVNSIIFTEIAKSEGIDASDEEIEEEYRKVSVQRNINNDDIRNIIPIQAIKISVINNKVVEKLISYHTL